MLYTSRHCSPKAQLCWYAQSCAVHACGNWVGPSWELGNATHKQAFVCYAWTLSATVTRTNRRHSPWARFRTRGTKEVARLKTQTTILPHTILPATWFWLSVVCVYVYINQLHCTSGPKQGLLVICFKSTSCPAYHGKHTSGTVMKILPTPTTYETPYEIS